MKHRKKSRELAVQILFQYDLRGTEIILQIPVFLKTRSDDEDLLQYSYPERIEILEYAQNLISGCIQNWKQLDAKISEYTKNWSLIRMAGVDRAVLRMAAYELYFCPDVPAEVIINEAVELGKYFSTANSGKFINGILDQMFKKGRILEKIDQAITI